MSLDLNREPATDLYSDETTGTIGFGRRYGEYTVNGKPLYPGIMSEFWGSDLLGDLDPGAEHSVREEQASQQVHLYEHLDDWVAAAESFERDGRSREAAEAYDHVLAALRTVEPTSIRYAETCLQTIWSNHILADHDKCISLATQALQILEGAADQTRNLVYAYNWLASLYTDVADYANAKIISERLSQLGVARIAACQVAGLLAGHLGEWRQAERLLREALALAKAEGNKAVQGILLNNLGELLLWQEHSQAAMDCCFESLRLRNELNDLHPIAVTVRGIAYCHSSIAQIYIARKQWDWAEVALLTALELFTQLGDARNANGQYYGYAVMLLERDANSAIARRYAERYFNYFKDRPFRVERAKGKRLLGKIDASRGSYREADSLLMESIQELEQAGNKYELAVSLEELGVLKHDTGSTHDEAVRYLGRAANIFRELGLHSRSHKLKETLR